MGIVQSKVTKTNKKKNNLKNKFEGEECYICTNKYNNNVTVLIPCEHTICDNCALIMKKGKQECPFCREGVNMWHTSVRPGPREIPIILFGFY